MVEVICLQDFALDPLEMRLRLFFVASSPSTSSIGLDGINTGADTIGHNICFRIDGRDARNDPPTA